MSILELMEEQKRLREEDPSLYGRGVTGEAPGLVTEKQVREEVFGLMTNGFLGIDVGIRQRTSWALIDRAGEVVSLGDVPVDPEMGNDRYAQLAVDLYRDLPWDKAEIVGIEWPWMGPNKYSAQTIAMATGAVIAVAALFGKEVMFLDSGRKAKMALTGDSLASGHRMRLEAERRWPQFKEGKKKPSINADRASAIGVGLAVWERRR